jgi:hypothetical protein
MDTARRRRLYIRRLFLFDPAAIAEICALDGTKLSSVFIAAAVYTI